MKEKKVNIWKTNLVAIFFSASLKKSFMKMFLLTLFRLFVCQFLLCVSLSFFDRISHKLSHFSHLLLRNNSPTIFCLIPLPFSLFCLPFIWFLHFVPLFCSFQSFEFLKVMYNLELEQSIVQIEGKKIIILSAKHSKRWR